MATSGCTLLRAASDSAQPSRQPAASDCAVVLGADDGLRKLTGPHEAQTGIDRLAYLKPTKLTHALVVVARCAVVVLVRDSASSSCGVWASQHLPDSGGAARGISRSSSNSVICAGAAAAPGATNASA